MTRKVVCQFHEGLHHGGTDFVLAHVRQYFWPIHGREVIKRASNACLTCIKERAKPGQQLMGDLLSGGSWGCTDGRARSIRIMGPIFWERKGSFRKKYKDFWGGKRKNGWRRKEIEWRFQPPRAPHFGRSHESLVKSTKRILYRALNGEKLVHQFPSPETLQTLLFEVAGMLNTRPLGYVSSDPKDFRSLRPHDFLNRPPVASSAAVDYQDALPSERYRYVQKMAKIFWDMWQKMYIQSLKERKQWKRPQNLEV